ncbi:MAG: OmpA family protein [Cyclobacteriaceae bacterium]
MKNWLLIGVVCLCSCSKSTLKHVNKGYTAFQKKEYGKAIKEFQIAKSGGAQKKDVDYLLAESYRLSNQLVESTPYYLAATKQEDENYDAASFWYAMALKSEGKYDESQNTLATYSKKGEELERVRKAKKEYQKLVELKRITRKKYHWEVKPVNELNTTGPDYGISVLENTLYFTKESDLGPVYQGQGTKYTDIYIKSIKENVLEVQPISPKINSPEVHEATPTISENGEIIVFARSNSGKKKDPISQVDLFKSENIYDEWIAPTRLQLNKRGYWSSTPFLYLKNNILYFSSDREGGRGGKDIWKADWDELNERFINVENLGSKVNTAGDEMFPFVNKNGEFFFSSDGHTGYGGLDIFKIKNWGKRSARAINLGANLNSSSDDFNIVFTTDSSGYFCSNRKGGKGFDDIYTFTDTLPNAKNAYYYLQGIVKGKVLDDTLNLDSTIVLPLAQVSLLDENQVVIDRTKSKADGEFIFEIDVEKTYSLFVIYPDFLKKRVSYSTVGKTIPQEALTQKDQDIVFKTGVVLDPLVEDIIISFDPIYFEYNKAAITPESEQVLDDMVAVMVDNREINVEIGSHTDPRSSDEYNQELSEKRAQAVVDYIVSKGVLNRRITAKGYGESQPFVVKKDENGIKKGGVLTHDFILALPNEAMREEAYRLNRRTEFKITEIFR